MTEPYCILPWIHLTSVPNGRSAPCCTWKGHHEATTGQAFFDGSWLEEFRQRMRDHQPPDGCMDCLTSEKLGLWSQRDDGWNTYKDILGHKQFVDNPKLEYIELNFSNICNLKCRMCGNDRSSKWTSDAEQMGFPVYGRVTNDIVVSDEMLQHLHYIKLLGGEPLLHEAQLIDILSRSNQLDQLSINIVTNGMILPNSQLVSLLARCKAVYWTISVDAFGQLNDYIRTGSSWPVMENNLFWFNSQCIEIPNWSMGIGSVCMIHNVNRMQQLADWVDENLTEVGDQHHWYPCNYPEYLAIKRLPHHYLESLAERYDQLASDAKLEWRRGRWWAALAEHMRSSMSRDPYIPGFKPSIATAGPSRELIEKLDDLRGDYLRDINQEVYEQIRGSNQ
jgi:4Fe-4S single cluster domain